MNWNTLKITITEAQFRLSRKDVVFSSAFAKASYRPHSTAFKAEGTVYNKALLLKQSLELPLAASIANLWLHSVYWWEDSIPQNNYSAQELLFHRFELERSSWLWEPLTPTQTKMEIERFIRPMQQNGTFKIECGSSTGTIPKMEHWGVLLVKDDNNTELLYFSDGFLCYLTWGADLSAVARHQNG